MKHLGNSLPSEFNFFAPLGIIFPATYSNYDHRIVVPILSRLIKQDKEFY
jgi:hypothetical protein